MLLFLKILIITILPLCVCDYLWLTDMTTTNSDFNEAIAYFKQENAGLVVQFIMDTQLTINVQCKYNFL